MPPLVAVHHDRGLLRRKHGGGQWSVHGVFLAGVDIGVPWWSAELACGLEEQAGQRPDRGVQPQVPQPDCRDDLAVLVHIGHVADQPGHGQSHMLQGHQGHFTRKR